MPFRTNQLYPTLVANHIHHIAKPKISELLQKPLSYGKPKIKQSSSLTTVPRTMQNQLYNTHLVANKTYKLKE